MPVYFGLPLECREIFRLFSIDYCQAIVSIKNKYANFREDSYIDHYLVEFLTAWFASNTKDLGVFYTDKGQCIVGYQIEISVISQYKFVNVDEFITLLSYLKTRFALETQSYWSKFGVVTLSHLEDESEVVTYPIPFVMEY
jgi:hypothetical protein